MSDHFPSIQTRKVTVPEVTLDLAKSFGLVQLAELKRNWSVKKPSGLEVMLAIRDDLGEKNNPNSKEKRVQSDFNDELNVWFADAIEGVVLSDNQTVSLSDLNKVMWQSLAPEDQNTVNRMPTSAETVTEWLSDSKNDFTAGEEADQSSAKLIQTRLDAFMTSFDANKAFDEAVVSPEEAEKIIMESLKSALPKHSGDELDRMYRKIVEAATGHSTGEIGTSEAISNYGKLRKAEAAFKAVVLLFKMDDPIGKILENVREALGEPVADALKSLEDIENILVERVVNDPDPEALIEAIEARDFRVCLELAVACAMKGGLWNENTKLSKYGLEGRFENMVREWAENLLGEHEANTAPTGKNMVHALCKGIRDLISSCIESKRNAYGREKAIEDGIRKLRDTPDRFFKNMSFGQMRGFLKKIDEHDEEL